MKTPRTVSSIELARRANNRATKRVTFEYSIDNQNWNDAGEVVYPNSGTPNSKVVMFSNPFTARYLRVIVVESHAGGQAAYLTSL